MASIPGPAPRRALALPHAPAWPALLVFGAAAALWIGWIGYAASDDAAYFLAADHWLSGPFAGNDHWATRYPLIVSLAAALKLFGPGEAAMAATAVGWYAAFLLAVLGLARRIAGTRAGWIAALLVATLPVVVTNATTVSCDLVEATFLLLGIRLAGDLAAGEGGRWAAPLAGAAFGAAIVCRETSALALFGFAPLFLLGRPIERRALVAIGLGCAALLGAEALFAWALTGDPLHRWPLAFHHDAHIDRAANLEGNFLVHPAIDPVLVLLVNDDFALLFWAAVAAVAFRFHRRLSRPGRRRMLVLSALAVATFVLVGALTTKLVLNPRYFMLPAIAAAVAVAAGLDGAGARTRAVGLALLVGANLLMLSAENQHPRWSAEALLAAARAHPGERIATDAETLHRAKLPLAWAGLAGVTAGPPAPGGLALSRADAVPAGAAIVQRFPSPPTPAGRIATALGLAPYIPARVAARLLAPNPEAVLYRATPR